MTLKEKLKRQLLSAGSKIPAVPKKVMDIANKTATAVDIATFPVGGGLKMIGKVGKGINTAKEVARLAAMSKKLKTATKASKVVPKVGKVVQKMTRGEKILLELEKNRKLTEGNEALRLATKKKMDKEAKFLYSSKSALKDKFKRLKWFYGKK
jgi:hypothetical protein